MIVPGNAAADSRTVPASVGAPATGVLYHRPRARVGLRQDRPSMAPAEGPAERTVVVGRDRRPGCRHGLRCPARYR